jgi:hypothetical protein
MRSCIYNIRTVSVAVLVYVIGDTIASVLLDMFSISRFLGIMFVGMTFYALEIPNYFNWIDRKVNPVSPFRKAILRTGLSLLYFNPLWISRHILFILLASGRFNEISLDLLRLGAVSWFVSIPLSIIANYIIQVRISLRRRFVASALFSSAMAIYYALCTVFF